MNSRWQWALLVLIILAGAWLRLDQYFLQVLVDDEWHAVHQLLRGRPPTELFLTFGLADYSIPLGLLYWFEAQWFGLSEFGMRWPMLLAGLATLVAFSWYAWRTFSPLTALLFAAGLAVSPMLAIYSHTARPYALTLLLSGLAYYAFYRYLSDRRTAWGVAYGVSAALCVWLHLVTGPFVIAPFLWETMKLVRQGSGRTFRRLLALGVPTALLMSALVLPPLLADSARLGAKAGLAELSLDTFLGVWHMWLGTPSGVAVLLILALAAIGLPALLRQSELIAPALFGLALTAVAVFVLQPEWVQVPLTFGRYLLPMAPLLILAAAMGVRQLVNACTPHGAGVKGALMAGLAALGIFYLANSPLKALLHEPNSYWTHSRLQFDFRPEHNRIAEFQDQFALSPFWEMLGGLPANSKTVAVAPFYFETWDWDAVRWEQVGGQRVRPAYLHGYCADQRWGEVPRDGRFEFRNAWYLSDLSAGSGDRPDWLVYLKPFGPFRKDQDIGNRRSERETVRCMAKLRQERGEPDYEDIQLIAYRLGPGESEPQDLNTQ